MSTIREEYQRELAWKSQYESMVQTVRSYLKLDESETNEDYENLSFLTEELEDSECS